MTSTWFERWSKSEKSQVRLYCFAHGGAGAAAIKSLGLAAPSSMEIIAVRLPGRETRFLDDFITDLPSMVNEIAMAIKNDHHDRDEPIYLLGQCSGAVLAYEVANLIQQELPLQGVIVVSRPSLDQSVQIVDLSQDDESFIREVVQIGGVHPEVLAEPMLMELLIPMVRADFQLMDGYVHKPEPKLSNDLLVIRGINDPSITLEMIEGWKSYTTGNVQLKEISGGHFLLEEPSEELLQVLTQFILDSRE